MSIQTNQTVQNNPEVNLFPPQFITSEQQLQQIDLSQSVPVKDKISVLPHRDDQIRPQPEIQNIPLNKFTAQPITVNFAGDQWNPILTQFYISQQLSFIQSMVEQKNGLVLARLSTLQASINKLSESMREIQEEICSNEPQGQSEPNLPSQTDEEVASEKLSSLNSQQQFESTKIGLIKDDKGHCLRMRTSMEMKFQQVVCQLCNKPKICRLTCNLCNTFYCISCKMTSLSPKRCPMGHELQQVKSDAENIICDCCFTPLKKLLLTTYSCDQCDMHICQPCHQKIQSWNSL